MRRLVWDKASLRSFKRWLKKHPDQQEAVARTLKDLESDPFQPHLATHKLKGKLSGYWACSAGFDIRVLFDFVPGSGPEDDILLIDLGSHKEVY